MILTNPLEIKQALNKSYQKEKVVSQAILAFKSYLRSFINKINADESEENAKNCLIEFLKDAFYKGKNEINTQGKTDLVIHSEANAQSLPAVLIETKKPNSTDMPKANNLNVKALQQLILYYFQERQKSNLGIKYLIITDIWHWFVFEESEFDRVFYKDTQLHREYKNWEKAKKDTDIFYKEIAKPFLDNSDQTIQFTYFSLRDFAPYLADNQIDNNEKLLPLFKFFSPQHLLKTYAYDANQLNRAFYTELLHLLGLEEEKEEGKKVIRRIQDPKKRNQGSLLENTLDYLEFRGILGKLPSSHKQGKTEAEVLFNIALELCITWINRILFLKLLEAQLVRFHQADSRFKFLTKALIADFADLNDLFFRVLAVKPNERKPYFAQKFGLVPYLNSSLFELSELEELATEISQLNSKLTLPYYTKTVLVDAKEAPRKGETDLLTYLFDFLEAYDFTAEGKEQIQDHPKGLINASVLGTVFEKINGYKEGSFYTPSFITMYMCRETIQKAVIQKFNGTYGWDCQDLNELARNTNRLTIKEVNQVINTLTVCDPAVGSGHFLVSALNEILYIKGFLGVLADENGKPLGRYSFEVANDELSVSNPENELFEYIVYYDSAQQRTVNPELNRVQKTLFNEKRQIIENCLFGVDINPNSVKICRLRLWIELLKNAYYTPESQFIELETLPNIDINIKRGNSLLSRFALNADLSKALKSIKYNINQYRQFVNDYKNERNREVKRGLEKIINDIKTNFRTEIAKYTDPRVVKLQKLGYELYLLTNTGNIFQEPNEVYGKNGDENKKKEQEKIQKLEDEINKLSAELEAEKNNLLYINAFEWRFEFPEVLDEEGNFKGFDCVIGNPPYIALAKIKEEAQALAQQGYATYSKSGDIYCLFYEKAIQILKPNGIATFITSNSWLRTQYGELLRKFLAEKTNPQQLLNLEDQQMFEEATVETNILVFANQAFSGKMAACIINSEWKNVESLRKYFESNKIILSNLNNEGWIIADQFTYDVKKKIEQNSIHLRELKTSINRGVLTGYNEAFFIDSSKKNELINNDPKNAEIIKPLLSGRDLKKYDYKWNNVYILAILPSLNIDIDNYPEIKKHLLSFGKERLEQTGKEYIINGDKITARKKTSNEWFETQDQITYWGDFEKPKIMWAELSDLPKFAYDEDGFYPNKTVFIMTGHNLKYLLSILNSKLILWYFNQISTTTGMGATMWSKYKVEQLPIKDISQEAQKPFENLVNQILDLKKAKANTDTSKLEAEIDAMVFDLYGLSEEEMLLVLQSQATVSEGERRDIQAVFRRLQREKTS
jgi:hypothetical protein